MQRLAGDEDGQSNPVPMSTPRGALQRGHTIAREFTVNASFQSSDPAKRRAALRSALSDPEPDVRAAALFEALSKLKVISGEMTPILPEGLVRTTRGFQLQIVGLDPATGQLNTIFVGFGTKWPVPGFVDDKLS